METPTQKHGFGNILLDSLGELRRTGAVIMTLVLIEGAVLLSFFHIRIAEGAVLDISFVCVMAAGLLYGPVPCMLTAAAGEVITDRLFDDMAREHLAAVLAVKLITALFWGYIMYRKHYGSFGCPKCLNDCLPECVLLNIRIAVRSITAYTAAALTSSIVLDTIELYDRTRGGLKEWLRLRFAQKIELLPFGLAIVLLTMPLVNIFCTLAGKAFERIRESGGSVITKN